MSEIQIARPNQDLSNNIWAPTPLWQQISKLKQDDATAIVSAGSANGDTFQVQLTPLDPPVAGPEQLLIRWQRLQTLRLPTTVTLLQGSTVIASRILYPPLQGYQTQIISLTPGEIASIRDYTQLSVKVSTAPPPILRRSLGTAVSSDGGQSLTLSNVTVYAGEMLLVSAGSPDVTVSSVTFNGTALPLAITQANTGICRASLYYLAVNSDTTGDVVVQWSSPTPALAMAADAVAALPQGVFGTAVGSAGSGTTATIGTVTTTTKTAYLHAVVCYFVPNGRGSYGLTWQNRFQLAQLQTVDNGPTPGALDEGYLIASASGPYTASAIISQPADWAGLLASFL